MNLSNLTSLTEKGWRSRMQTASFRGVKFPTDSHDAKGGRRKVQHEYPGSDESDVEDMGQKAWDYNLAAYCIGDDYDKQRDELIKALNQPEPAWLVHPWLGRLWVVASEWTITESNDKGGYCAIQITFLPTREDEAAAEADEVDLAAAAAEDFGDLAESDFSLLEMSADGFAAFKSVVSGKLEILRNVLSVASLPLSMIQGVQGMIAGAINDVDTLLSIPGRYASALRSIYSTISSSTSVISSNSKPRIIARLTSQTKKPVQTITGPAAYEAAVKTNIAIENALTPRIIVATVADMAIDEYETSEDRDAVLSTVTAAIDELLPDMLDELFQSAMTLRTHLVNVLVDQDFDPAVTRMIVRPLPAIVLAHRLNVNVDDFIARNNVVHPLFVSGQIYV